MSLSNPIIRDVRVRAVRVPMPDPHQTASGVVSESPLVLTDVTVEGGVVGHSIVFPRIRNDGAEAQPPICWRAWRH